MTTTDSTPAFLDIPRERLAREGVVRETVGEVEVLAVATPSGVRVYSGICPHLGGPLLEGPIRDGIVLCPWHGYRFDLSTGRCLTAPGRPWRSLVGGSPDSEDPLEVPLTPLRFEEREQHVRVHLPNGRPMPDTLAAP